MQRVQACQLLDKKNKKKVEKKLEMKKHCEWCRKHTTHKEVKNKVSEKSYFKNSLKLWAICYMLLAVLGV